MQRAHPARPPRPGKSCSGRKIGSGAAGDRALILGAVIAGGRSSRFGSDKALALLDGRPLIAHAAGALQGHVEAIIVCGRDIVGWTCLADRPAPDLGPLGGIAAALHYAFASRYDAVVTIGCDMPHVPGDLVDTLIAAAPSYCAEAPILGCWPSVLATDLDRHLARDTARSIRGWASAIRATPIAAGATLANINTPADLAAL